MELGVLLTLPVESIAVRAVLAAVLAVIAARWLLRDRLHTPGARVAGALAPAAALVLVVLATATAPRLPALMLPSTGADSLPIPIGTGHVGFAPLALPVIVAVWAVISGLRVTRRALALGRTRWRSLQALRAGRSDPRLDAMVVRLATGLGIAKPRLTILPEVVGGAYVVGSRRPIVVLGASLIEQLDASELEGVLAHELAHVRRRDNLVALGLGVLRDLAFFVPGGGWAVRQLHRERELAADQIAVGLTGRPGALASGLLKVLEAGPRIGRPCAAFAPPGTLVDRVRVLVDDAPAPTRLRRGAEVGAVVVVVAAATAAAITVPAAVAGPERERDALAVLWASDAVVTQPAMVEAGEARIFDVYRRSDLGAPEPSIVIHGGQDEYLAENRRGAVLACGVDELACPVPERRVGLGLQPRPMITIDDALVDRWRATPVGNLDASSGRPAVYWLSVVQ